MQMVAVSSLMTRLMPRRNKKRKRVRWQAPDLTGVENKGGEITSAKISVWAVFCLSCYSFMLATEGMTMYNQCDCGQCMAWRDESEHNRLVLHMQGGNRVFYRRDKQEE